MSKLIKTVPTIGKNVNSIHNLMVVILTISGLFVLYRYMKSIENDTKNLNNYIIELNMRIRQIEQEHTAPTKQFAKHNDTLEDCDSTGLKPGDEYESENSDDDDNSIKSEDITNLLKKVMFGSNVVVDTIPNEEISVEEDVSDLVVDDDSESSPDIDIIMTRTDSTHLDYSKMTNSQLKELLKQKGLSLKGAKHELIERLCAK